MRSTMKTAIILSMLALMCNIDTNAQNTIEGRVTDKETRQPLESATVIIHSTRLRAVHLTPIIIMVT